MGNTTITYYNIRGFVREKSSNAGGFSSTLGMIFQKSDCGDFMGILQDFMGKNGNVASGDFR